MDEQQRVIAAFDFDGTISTRDSLLPFLLYRFSALRIAWGALLLIPFLLAYLLGFAGRQRTKERLFEQFFFGVELSEFQKHATDFSEKRLGRLIRPNALERIKWHKEQGHQLVVISASVGYYLEPWAKANGFEAVIASKLATNAGRITGRLAGLNCRAEEKVRRLKEYLGSQNKDYTLYAYGDSRGDKELLEFADHSFYRFF